MSEQISVPSGTGLSGDIDWSKVHIGDPPSGTGWFRESTPAARLVTTPDTLAGSIRFDGTRIGLRTVLGALTGATKEQVEVMYPGLPEGWYDVVEALRPYLRRSYRQSVPKP